MASSSPSLRLLLLFATVALAASGTAAGVTMGLEFHHRFSDRVRPWAEAHGGLPGGWWPEKGSVEYYATLARHDRALRGRGRALADGSDPDKNLAFADGNSTVQFLGLYGLSLYLWLICSVLGFQKRDFGLFWVLV